MDLLKIKSERKHEEQLTDMEADKYIYIEVNCWGGCWYIW